MPELNTSVRYLKGVGPKRQSYLNNLGIETIEDLIHETPRGWEERRFLNNLALAAGPKRRAFFGEIVSAVESMSPRQDFCFFKAVIRTNNNFAPRLVLTWIRRRSRFDIFAKLRREIAGGRKIFVFGRLELDQIFKNSEIALIVEDYEIAAGLPAAGPSAHWGRLAPVYPATKGLEQKMLRSFRWEAMRVWKTLGRPAPWPEAWKQKLPQGAMDLKRAYEIIHFPANEKELEHARVALAFWDIFLLTTAMEIRRRQILQIRKPHCYIKEGTREQGNEGIRGESVIGRYDYPPLFTKLLEKLDIKLTASQDLAVQEILKDMDKPFPMNRLLQGEVGSGKTLVAVGALCRAAGAGYQTAFIAPTEILAFQHFMNFRRMLEPLGLTIGCLTGDTPAKERTGLLENLQNGSLKLIVGTHTLLEPQVRFHNLALTIIDEQHRFGVDQRWKMRRKAARPDTLIMTATPIPRTLALALYGELDISTMEELPMGRAIAPAVLCESENKAWDLLNCRLQKGLQAYIVVPAIEDKDDPGYNLEKEYSRLKEKFSGISIKIMHGRMPAHEKEAVLMDFNCGKTAILLSSSITRGVCAS
ncbi:MAG: DEAD/DEAH box helicase [Elusimicrobia bacterium]|nr:DEAD/DEAH box helicase [Elusimicrobiota bacterium]